MDKTTAKRISRYLERLDQGSSPYSRIKSLYDEEVRGFSFKPRESDNFGAHLISGKERNLWLVSVKWPDRDDYSYTVAVFSDKKKIYRI